MPQYRFTLGQHRDSVNLVTNGTFNTDLSGWTADPGWTWNAGTARLNGSLKTLIQSNIFTPGKRYELQYDIISATLGYIDVRMGVYGKETDNNGASPIIGTIQKNRIVLTGTDLTFKGTSGGTPIDIDNIEAYEMIWNEPLNNEPIGWNEAKISIKRDPELNGLFYTYTSDLTFYNDGYEYIQTIKNINGYCGKIPVLIEKKCGENQNWITLFEGIILLTDCEFNEDECTVKTKVRDRGASQIIETAKDVKVIFNADSWNHSRGLEPTNARELIDFHDAAGTYPVGYRNIHCFIVDDLLQLITLSATDLEMLFESDFFTSGTFDKLALSIGYGIRNKGSDPTDNLSRIPADVYSMSFRELFKELNKIFNLSFRIKYTNNVPIIQVEDKISFQGTSAFTLNNVPGIVYRMYPDNFYKTIDIGYEITLDLDQLDKKGSVQYVSDDKCSEENLDLTNEFIQDSDLIHGLLDGTITDTKYDKKIFIIECEGTEPNLQTKKFGAGNDYNGNIDPADNMERWANTLNNGLFRERDADSPDEVLKTNTPLPYEYEFEYPISEDQLDSIINDGTQSITFNKGSNPGDEKTGYILEVDYEVKSGLAKFKLNGS